MIQRCLFSASVISACPKREKEARRKVQRTKKKTRVATIKLEITANNLQKQLQTTELNHKKKMQTLDGFFLRQNPGAFDRGADPGASLLPGLKFQETPADVAPDQAGGCLVSW